MADFSRRKGPVCYRCGQDDFISEKQLSAHLQFVCNGSKCTLKKRRFTENMPTQRHNEWSYPLDVMKKRKTRKDQDVSTRECDDLKSEENEQHNKTDADIYFEGAAEEMAKYGSSESGDGESSENEYESDSASGDSTEYISPDNMPDEMAKLPFKSYVGPTPTFWQYQIDLAEVLGRHRTDLSLYNEIIELTQRHSTGPDLKFSSNDLVNRNSLIKKLEDAYETLDLKPKDVDVELTTGQTVTMSYFDAEAMILSLLNNEDLMIKENLATGYDVYSGKPTEPVTHYGEIHTGEAWESAREHYCGDNPQNMPIALIIFGDKSHFDLHGALATTPISFTLSCFNEQARNRAEFWRPLGYIPNLDFSSKVGGRKINKRPSSESVEDEHKCLSIALESLKRIHKNGGISTTVMGKSVVCKVWIHYIVGDTSGNNRLVGHYNSSGKLKCPYRDCLCSFDQMEDSKPECTYITKDKVREARKLAKSATNKKTGKKFLKDISKHDIDLSWHEKWVPLSDLIHGVFKMVPPELLHTTMEGVTEYIFEVLGLMISEGDGGDELLDIMELVHRKLHYTKNRNSERDLPKSCSRTGLFMNTRCGATERRGNLFLLLCLSHTSSVSTRLESILSDRGVSLDKFQLCLKLYLAMEEWFHSVNKKEEVEDSRKLIGYVIDLIKKVFPRGEVKNGQGWKIPKMHGLTKMQTFIKLFGCGINFFGGPGETFHKKFVKDTGNNTQGRADSFSSQCAQRYYETLLFTLSQSGCNKSKSKAFTLVRNDNRPSGRCYEGRYVVDLQLRTARFADKDRKKEHLELSAIVVRALLDYLKDNNCKGKHSINGYACCKMIIEGRCTTFRCSDLYMGDRWYDWCMVDFVGEDNNSNVSYPAKILGMFQLHEKKTDMDDGIFAVIHASKDSLSYKELLSKFVTPIELGRNLQDDVCVVPVHSIIRPLYVFQNDGGLVDEHFCALPRRMWSDFFGRKVKLI